MELMEVNAGRFYCRPLRHDSRVDDSPVIAQILAGSTADRATEHQPAELLVGSDAHHTDDGADNGADTAEFFAQATAEWENDTAYRFAVAEQTNVEMLALATVAVTGKDCARITVQPAGDPARVLPTDDEELVKVTVADGVTATEEALARWAQGFLGKRLTRVDPAR